jgi:hypothetical protein
MASIPNETRQRLARLLSMLGSEHDGEVLNAARLATRTLRDLGCTWSDALSAPPPDDLAAPPPDDDEPAHWRDAVRICLRDGGGVLTPWEMTFCHNLSTYRTECTERQQELLRNLYDRVTVARACA